MEQEFWQALSRALAQQHSKLGGEAESFAAAVLIPLLWRNGQLELLFEVRAHSLKWQPGEICFPGGRIEATDGSAEAAAVRETAEELGLDRAAIQVIGRLPAIHSPIGVVLHPVVGTWPAALPLAPGRGEVAATFTVPLAFFLHTEPKQAHMEMGTRPMEDFPFDWLADYPRGWKRRKTYPIWFYRYEGHVIWGLTAEVVRRFLAAHHACAAADTDEEKDI